MNKAILLNNSTIIHNNIKEPDKLPFLIKHFQTEHKLYNYKSLKSELASINKINLLLLVQKSDREYDIIKTIKKCDSILNFYQYYISYIVVHSVSIVDINISDSYEKNENEDNDLHRISSGANLTLSIIHCMSEIEFDLNDHIYKPNDGAEAEVKIEPSLLKDMWMIFDHTGRYLSIYKTLEGAKQYVVHLNTIENKDIKCFYPDISPEDNQLIVVSLSFNKNELIHYAMRVKINVAKNVSIKDQIIHWKKVNAEYIHKYIT